jgi:hypothetical protein
MSAAAHPHDVLLQQLNAELADVFSGSSQGIYVYLDDPHWICNDRLATMLGYASGDELHRAATGTPFLDVAIAPGSQQNVVDAYRRVVDAKVASNIKVTWKKKDGGTVNTQVIFAPISFKGNLLAIHFVNPA